MLNPVLSEVQLMAFANKVGTEILGVSFLKKGLDAKIQDMLKHDLLIATAHGCKLSYLGRALDKRI